MSTARLAAVTAVAVILAWVASAAEGFVLLLAALSGWCSDSSTDCAAQQSGAESSMVIFGLAALLIAIAVTYIVIYGLARPRIQRRRWYLAAAIAILAMPLAVIAGALWTYDALGHSPGARESAIATAILIQLTWPVAWAVALGRVTTRHLPQVDCATGP
jgi:hypothetical protein